MSSIAEKVCAVMSEVGAVGKDKTNDYHRYQYVSAEKLRAKVQRACAKNGLMLRITYSHDDHVSPSETVLKAHCAVSVDGQTWVELGEGWGAGLDKTEKSPMKACTAAAKYAIANAFCIALGDDPEADADTDREAEREPEMFATLAKVKTRADLDLWARAHGDDVRGLPGRKKKAAWGRLLKAARSVGIADPTAWFGEKHYEEEEEAA